MASVSLDRRTILGALGASLVPVPALAVPSARALTGAGWLGALERRSGGRLGVMVLDSARARGFGWRQDERFAHCSTFKLSLAAMVLAQIDAGRARGDEVVPYSVLDVLPASPVTGAAAEKIAADPVLAGQEGLPVFALAEAAVERSDNLAANLLLARFGGPAALTAFWRATGDPISRLDHHEPALNRVAPGADQDTTTPAAMAATVARLLTGSVLSGESRARLWGWMKGAPTGLGRLRGGLPARWQGGDKTGTWTGAELPAKINDIALALAPVGDRHFSAPLAVTAYYEPLGTVDAVRPEDEAVLAAVMRIAADPAAWRPQRR
ncbi:class A beta-lactamase [Novosphingobium sp. Fuku2-ISO-50]|uniref:class A beta-lactamase n=1 Tax=Novosphingobium sp. Fuku2-ISO-50 TaxID=1739114 RepID=UPI00076D16C7|nr:class A beta-lactamase [Novosphingobium sp. Fuku2-ISO-50]KUR78714.1 class A beta-lactamase [Novosphingobium sp. Fuku2-ISO-50]